MDSQTVLVVIGLALPAGGLLVACGILGPEWARWIWRWITSRTRDSQ